MLSSFQRKKLSTTTPTGVLLFNPGIAARMQGSDHNIPDVPCTMYYSGNYAGFEPTGITAGTPVNMVASMCMGHVMALDTVLKAAHACSRA